MKLSEKLINRLKYILKYKPRKSLNGLDVVIEKYLDIQGGTFIEVGANDGINQSNTYYLEVCKGWNGLLIEPVERLYRDCCWNRPKSTVINRALVSSQFEETHVTVHDSNLMSLVQAGKSLTSAEEQHLAIGRDCQDLVDSPATSVAALTLSDLIENIGSFENVDLFSLDVEGFELDVIEGIDFEKHRPRYILVETSKRSEVQAALESNNYTFIEKCTYHDYLFKSEY